nr:putative reverse transcriptase domain-containing protein [Tanacetum cinerariifolium]
MQTNQFTEAVSLIPSIVDKYIDHRMNEAVKVAIPLQSDRLRDEAQAENEDFLNKLDENIQKIIKEQVKEQVKISYVVAIDLSELELKKILIEKIESNKSIHRSDEQKNLYKALVDAYECDKLILDTYRDMVTLKRRQDDEDKDEEPSAGSNRGSKRRREGKELESTSAPKENPSKTSSKSTEGFKYQHKIASESAPAEEPMHTTQDLEELAPQEFETGETDDQPPWINNLAKKADSCTSFNELMDTPVDFSAFMMNRLKVDTLNPELLAGPTYELMKGSCKSLFYGFAINKESARDVYSKRRIIAVTELQIVEWHNYKHLDWITNKDKQNRLMRIDELHKFSDDTFNDVRTALDDHPKGIRIQYLPQTIWRRSDKDRAATMIQSIDKQLKTRRIMWSLEKFVGSRLKIHTQAGNPVKEILLKLNLPDHRILKDGGEGEARVAFKDEFGAAEEREVSCEAQQGRSGVKRKLFRSYRNNMGDVRTLIIEEVHATKYSLRPKVKDEHQRSSGLLLQPEMPDWKWEKERFTMDSKSKIPRSSSGCDAIWVIFDRLAKLFYFLAIKRNIRWSSWQGLVGILTFREAEIGESKMNGLELEQETNKATWPIVVRRESEKTMWSIMVKHAYVKTPSPSVRPERT